MEDFHLPSFGDEEHQSQPLGNGRRLRLDDTSLPELDHRRIGDARALDSFSWTDDDDDDKEARDREPSVKPPSPPPPPPAVRLEANDLAVTIQNEPAPLASVPGPAPPPKRNQPRELTPDSDSEAGEDASGEPEAVVIVVEEDECLAAARRVSERTAGPSRPAAFVPLRCNRHTGVLDLSRDRIVCACAACERTRARGGEGSFLPHEFAEHAGVLHRPWRNSIRCARSISLRSLLPLLLYSSRSLRSP